jgi:hypothetical protein
MKDGVQSGHGFTFGKQKIPKNPFYVKRRRGAALISVQQWHKCNTDPSLGDF